MDKTAEQKREYNRRKYPWIADFIDQLRKAGFENAKVVKIEKHNFFENRDREVAQVEVTEHFKLTHFATRSACERLEVTQVLDSHERRG